MKKRILSFVFVLCLLIPCALTLVACGKDDSKSPFNVSGKTFEGTGECMFIWEDGVTKEQKQTFITSQFGDKTLEEIYANLATSEMGTFINGMTIEYKKDGSLVITSGTSSAIEGFYVQSEDLKEITNYRDAEHTRVITDGLGRVAYIGNGNYSILMDVSEGVCKLAFVLKLV